MSFQSVIIAYFFAYLDGKDVIQVEYWMMKHRSHRGHSDWMDERIYKLYYPNSIQVNIIQYGNDDNACYNELDRMMIVTLELLV